MLDLYDPDRARQSPIEVKSGLGTFSRRCRKPREPEGAQGAGMRFLTGPINLPSLAEMMADDPGGEPAGEVDQYDPITRATARA